MTVNTLEKRSTPRDTAIISLYRQLFELSLKGEGGDHAGCRVALEKRRAAKVECKLNYKS